MCIYIYYNAFIDIYIYIYIKEYTSKRIQEPSPQQLLQLRQDLPLPPRGPNEAREIGEEEDETRLESYIDNG